MNFSLNSTLQILESTPGVLKAWLTQLNDEWTKNNEGENTWSAKDIVAHLIICEKTNWLVRAKIILSQDSEKILVPIDMSAHFDSSRNTTLNDLIKNFTELREASVKELKSFNLDEDDLQKTAQHPTLGEVKLQQLLSTWTAHDLCHIAQISRVMAKQYKENVGPFIKFLRFINN